MIKTIFLKSLEDIQHSIKSPIDGADGVVIDWIDLEDAEIQEALKKLFFQRRRKWASVEIRKCIGHCMPMVIRWILEASADTPIQTLSLVSVMDEDVALAIRSSFFNNENRPNFAELEILGSQLSPQSLDLIFQGLCRDSCHAEIISFSNSNFLQNSATKLAEGVSKCLRLRKLNLFLCRMADEEVAELVNALRIHRHPLKFLDLGNNRCLSMSMEAIGKWIASPNIQLESLNLSLQHLGFQMMHLNPTPVFSSLAQNNSLRALYLRGNPMDISDGTCIDSVVQSLTENDSLEILMLTDCLLSNEAHESILHNLCNFKGLRKLWLDGMQRHTRPTNPTNPRLSRTVAEGLRWNRNVVLDELHLPFRFTDLLLEIHAFMDWNFGGRRLLFQDGKSAIEVLPALWPQVLERVNKADLPRRSVRRQNGHDIDKGKSIRRADMMYFMLRENASLQHLLNR
jgi:hypothetical protein